MLTNNHLPMLGSVRSGDTPGESTWDRQDYRDRYHVRSRFDRRYKAVARRGLRRIERDELAAGLVAELEAEAAFLPSLASEAWADWASDFFRHDAAYRPQIDEEDEIAAILDDFDVATFAELAVIVAGDVAEAVTADLGDSPGWGDTFDPAEVQWGFSVRTRP